MFSKLELKGRDHCLSALLVFHGEGPVLVRDLPRSLPVLLDGMGSEDVDSRHDRWEDHCAESEQAVTPIRPGRERGG